MNQKQLTEKQAEDFLEKEGFKVASRATIKSKEEISKIRINFPWAMKVSSKNIIHKLKQGGVILNIKTKEQAEEAIKELKKIKDFEEIIIQEMLKGKEIIIGIKETAEFGRVIMLGKGGSNVEQEKDVSFRAVPIAKKDAEQMLEELNFFKEIKNSGINIEAITNTLLKVSSLAEKHNNLKELDINPLIVNNTQAVIADARIILKK